MTILPSLSYLLFAYGITFGIQNKATFLRGRFALLDSLVMCTYCVGFHAGWMAWLVGFGAENPASGSVLSTVLSILTWGLSSAAFSYGVDSFVRWSEYRPKE